MAKQIHILVLTHQGVMYDEVCDYIVINGRDGEFAIFPDHVATITAFDEGFLKLVRGKDVLYMCLVDAIIEFNKNKFSALAQETSIGLTKEKAKSNLNEVRKDRLETNRKLDADLALSEKELIDNIKKANIGNL